MELDLLVKGVENILYGHTTGSKYLDQLTGMIEQLIKMKVRESSVS
jgi:hypothetical protein